MAATTFGWPWPTFITAMPPAKSMNRRPSTSHSSAPWARSAKKLPITPTPRGVAAALRAISCSLREWFIAFSSGGVNAQPRRLQLGVLVERVQRLVAAVAALLVAAEGNGDVVL